MTSTTVDTSADSLAQAQFIAMMKAQERVAILGVLTGKRQEIQSDGLSLSTALTAKATEMKNFASQTVPSDLKEAFEGETADAANDYLINRLYKPTLPCPIK